MKICYPLKKSEPVSLVQPIIRYIQTSQSPNFATQFRDNLSKITQLRTKATTIELPNMPTIGDFSKRIVLLQMYMKYCLIMAKHLNWTKQYGIIVEDLKLTWMDSFNSNMKFMKNQINYDIFCGFYNLGVMYFHKAQLESMEDLDSMRKESIKSAKFGFYLFNQMRTVYYPQFVNTGFSDTNYSHIEMLEYLCQGIIYKCLFNLFKGDQYSKGIDKVASLAGLAQTSFYNAYQIGTQFFMKSSNISPKIKGELLSFSYVQALYHDTMFNIKYAKYYQQQMDNDKDNIIYLLAYQKKALRLLDLGLKNDSVKHLLEQRPIQNKELENLKPEIQALLNKNLMRNQEIYKRKEIKEEQIPAPRDPPKAWIATPVEPQKIQIDYSDPTAAPFAQLINNESKGFTKELQQFRRNRINGMQSAFTKLQATIENSYNNNYVNFYINMQNSNKNKGLPESLKQKIKQINLNGGKPKIDLQISIIKNSSLQIEQRFKDLKSYLAKQQKLDSQKRNQYGRKWRRPPSASINRSYINQIEVYEKKSAQANIVNRKIIDKAVNLEKYLQVVGKSENDIMAIMPKIQVNKFKTDNQGELEKLLYNVQGSKANLAQLQGITINIKKFLQNLNLDTLGSKHYEQAKKVNNKQSIFDEIFGGVYPLIDSFNYKSKNLIKEAEQIGKIALGLNSRNTSDQKSKDEFEQAMRKFSDILSMFKQLMQGTSFYTKMNDVIVKISSDMEGFLTARKLELKELQDSIKRGGDGGNPNLPSMYPNAPNQNSNAGFYVPPPMKFSNNNNNQGMNFSDMASMLEGLNKPNAINPNVFSGNVYESRYK